MGAFGQTAGDLSGAYPEKYQALRIVLPQTSEQTIFLTACLRLCEHLLCDSEVLVRFSWTSVAPQGRERVYLRSCGCEVLRNLYSHSFGMVRTAFQEFVSGLLRRGGHQYRGVVLSPPSVFPLVIFWLAHSFSLHTLTCSLKRILPAARRITVD